MPTIEDWAVGQAVEELVMGVEEGSDGAMEVVEEGGEESQGQVVRLLGEEVEEDLCIYMEGGRWVGGSVYTVLGMGGAAARVHRTDRV